MALLESLQWPETARSPVGYKTAFLTGYSNTKPFLDRKTREHLRAVGQRGTPGQPAGTYARKILDRLLIDLSWNSSRLEGNTYSLLETEQLIAQMQNPEGRDAQETQLILNHKQTIGMRKMESIC